MRKRMKMLEELWGRGEGERRERRRMVWGEEEGGGSEVKKRSRSMTVKEQLRKKERGGPREGNERRKKMREREKNGLEARYNKEIGRDHDSLPWLIRHASATINRYVVGMDGRGRGTTENGNEGGNTQSRG